MSPLHYSSLQIPRHQIASDGESNWMEGALLLAVYVILGMAFYFLPA